MADFNKNIDLEKGFNSLLNDVKDVAKELRKEGQEAVKAVGVGVDEGVDETVGKIKASEIKINKAFKGLSEKIKKQSQQFAINIGGKNTKVNIDFSNIDINNAEIQKQIKDRVGRLQISDVIDFDTSIAENQLTNFVTLFMKYKGKFDSLKQDYSNIKSPKEATDNLRQQIALGAELVNMYKLFNQDAALFSVTNVGLLRKELSKVQKFDNADTSKSVGEYDKLAEVLKEIQGSLKVISDTFANENNSMKKMAQEGTTSFESMSQAIVEVYKNLTQIQSLIGNTSKKGLNIADLVNVEAEEAKLRGLVDVITKEVGNALDGIKTKFSEALTVPELDKNNLQASFDEIYNKFAELKNNIGTMKIDIGVNTANITTAIQEALYAKEIQKYFTKVSFDDVYSPPELDFLDFSTLKDEWTNAFTGEIMSYDQAMEDFEKHIQGMYRYKGKYDLKEVFTTQEMLDRITQGLNASEPEQNNFAQVIVEAINTQGGKIVESIKLLLPKNITDNIDETELINAFDTLTKAIQNYTQMWSSSPKSFFNSIRNGGTIGDASVDDALEILGLMSNGRAKFHLSDEGSINTGTVIGSDYILSTQPNDGYGVTNIKELMRKQNLAYESGASVPRIIAGFEDEDFGTVYQLQAKVPGVNHRKANNGMFEADDEQIDRLLFTLEKLRELKLYPEFRGDNVMYDEKKGFSIIDLNLRDVFGNGLDDPDKMLNSFLDSAMFGYSDKTHFSEFEDRVRKRYAIPMEQRLVNEQTIAAERASQVPGANAKITPIMDEGAVAKVVADNVAKTPATVKVIPVIDDSYDTDSLINKYIDAIKQSDPSLKVKEIFEQNPLLKAFNEGTNGLLETDLMFSKLGKANDEELNNFRNKFKNFVNGTGSDVFANGPASQSIIDAQKAIDIALESQQAIGAEGQEAIDVTKQFVEAAKAKLKFVDANKQVAKSAEESAEAVKKEAEAIDSIDVEFSNDSFMNPDDNSIKTEAEAHKENTEAIKAEIDATNELAKAKERDVMIDGQHRVHEDVYKGKGDGANLQERVAQHISVDKDGNEVRTIIKTIIKDFEAFNKEEKKTEENINKMQSKLNEFIEKFKSKTGGNAQFIEGFNALSSFEINKDNVASVENLIKELQARYNELEASFRKGQASLNPFTNAINKASNIDNIFGEVEYKFNTVVNKSDELVDKFTRLQDLSQKIKDFVNRINTESNTIKPQEFSEFAENVGSFNSLKTQIEGTVKIQRRNEVADAKEQAKAYGEILRLVKERNKALQTATSAEQGSIKQRNALMDAYKIEQQLQILGKQIVLTDEQRAELARIREEQARKIRDIEADNAVKANNQKASAREQKRQKEVEEYIKLVQKKNEYEAKAAKGGAMQATYEAKAAQKQEEILANDKKSIMTQEEKNRLLAIEEAHQLKIAEIKSKGVLNTGAGKQSLDTLHGKLQGKHDAGYLSGDAFRSWQNELETYKSYLAGTVAADDATIAKQKQKLTQLYDHLTKISNASRTFFASGGEMLPRWLSQDEINNAKNSLMQLYEQLASDKFAGMETKFIGFSGANEQIKKLTFTVNDGKGALDQYTIALDTSSGATKLLNNSTKGTLKTIQQFGKALKTDVRGMFSAFIGGMSGMYAIGRYFKEGIQYVRELDKALTELKKVTDETEETYDRFLETAGKTSTRIGSTLSNMTSATAEFAKLGYDIETASSMAESALVYTNVGDNVDVETGSQSIISTLKAFGIEANNTMSIVDKFNEIGNNFAITTAGIGDALQVSASAMAEAGNSLDETIALTTAAM